MEDTSLTPYRAGPPAVQPIEESLVPDCGRREIAGLKDKLNQLNQECNKVGVARRFHVFWRVWLTSLFTAFFLVSAVGIIIAASQAAIFFTCLAAIVVTAIASDIVSDEAHQKAARIERTKRTPEEASLLSRMSALESLELLTGKGEHASKLLSEVALFNLHLKNLSAADCSASDRELIDAKRAEIMGRIHALRSQTLEAPEPSASALLAAINDD